MQHQELNSFISQKHKMVGTHFTQLRRIKYHYNGQLELWKTLQKPPQADPYHRCHQNLWRI